MLQIPNVEQAVFRAEQFVRKYYSYLTLVSVVKEQEEWLVEFDVGIFAAERVKVTLNAQSGEVIGYSKPGKSSFS